MMKIAMIPARMGSKRLPKKNLALLRGKPLIQHAIEKCLNSGSFDEVYVNSEHVDFAKIAEDAGAKFHRRPEHLGSDTATSEDFVEEFLKHRPCDFLFQVHSIAPLLTVADLRGFSAAVERTGADVTLSTVDDQLEALCNDKPVNFTFLEKTNSQELAPVKKISWSVTAWKRETFLQAKSAGKCATYSGALATHPVNKMAGHVIKTAEDLAIADALFDLVHAD